MRRAIAGDFANVPGTRVFMTLDERFPDEPQPESQSKSQSELQAHLASVVRVGPGEEVATLLRLAAAADYTVLIAPETGGILAERTRALEQGGGRGLGSSVEAIELTADKHRLGRHLAALGIATPPGRRVVPRRGLPADAPYPAVLKPIDGAGSLDTYLIPAADLCPEAAREMPAALLQPLVPGIAHSASFLVGRDGRARLIAAGRQHVEIREGRFVYCGGTVPVPSHDHDRVSAPPRAVESVPGLRGFVGVDYLWDDAAGCATVLEINPRPTTSCVGLTRWLPAGMLARAWLRAASEVAPVEGNEPAFPDLAPRNPVTFAADGGIMECDEGTLR
jgi:predicted ATP-grasp superfamily ATP-dependent carboligase